MKHEVEIWQAWVEDAKPFIKPLTAFLSQEEKARGRRLVNPEHSQRFFLAHAILRDVLSHYIALTPDAIHFSKGAHGKPYIKDSDFQFNLTHSNECVLVAVTQGMEVGIDVEFLEKTHRFDDLIQRFFSQEEQQEYHLYTSEAERRLAFYRGWTRKEAYLKATGLGLSYPLNQFAVSLAPNDPHALLHVEGDTTVNQKWTLCSFNVNINYLASIAVKARVDNFQTFHWFFRTSS